MVASIVQRQHLDVGDVEAVRSHVESCLERHLGNRSKSHATTTWAVMRRQRTCHEREIRARQRSQRYSNLPAQSEKDEQYVSPFTNMSSIQTPFINKPTKERLGDITQEIFGTASSKDGVIRSSWNALRTTYKSTAIQVPPFTEYVSLKNNILTDNESKLLATPYFDEASGSSTSLLADLPLRYEMRHDENALLDLRAEQCRFYTDSVNAFLCEIGLTWDNVLYWLLAPSQAIKRINGSLAGNHSFERLLLERSAHHAENFQRDEESREAILFDRNSRKWRKFLLQLTEPTADKLRLVALACAAVLHECGFSIWYLVQQSKVMRLYKVGKTNHATGTSKFTYKETVCRVCHEHNCVVHGELKENPENDSDSEDQANQASQDTAPAHTHDDSDLENLINYKVPTNPNAILGHTSANIHTPKTNNPSDGKRLSKWRLQDSKTQWEERKPFFPCNHEGTCDDAQCRCYREGISCEKTCKCSSSCHRRFPGCTCLSTPGKRACDSEKCLCLKSHRECDADLCSACGATEILDPVNRYDESILSDRCFNVSIQRGVPRKTLLGNSQVHGFGLYMGEDTKEGEYIGEYTGETISIKEGTRREIIAEYKRTLYTFQLNLKQDVDATYMGNKTRFMNNADDKFTNCKSKILLCNTVFRIGIYAESDIKAGTELFFNYHYTKEQMQNFKRPDGKVIAIKQTVNPKGKSKSSATASHKPPLPAHLVHPAAKPRKLQTSKNSRTARAAKRATQLSEQALRNSFTSHPISDTDHDGEWADVDADTSQQGDTAAEASDVYDMPGDSPDDSTSRHKLSKRRTRVRGMSSVVAVKTKKDGARSSVLRSKRKRPMVSSDEE
ncbi:hypothetical protein P153DRAFT_285701 [Dothidotthia symphoricarpi CBS 119687]|uniref:SET domain-containing protein n=1 Tax=Dothidotthia symphoricarpi CBS 119687 TaxID=1392245 RepID=A0A6A6AIX6_9PLEO|nr:uncharacterized protein P153DRAFT_285701 [Dothidotthia symphoricarpi CBS 119687]KAF2131922.1 hypothetical protein P153DRAFT_285701 [Dothidotthia symphoricarpi CBS 119687]